MTRRSRLWRKLGATQEVFNVWFEGIPSLGDHVVSGIEISRGTNSPDAGIHTPTATVNTIASSSVQTNRAISIRLTYYGADLVAAMCGADPATIRPRFFGRIGKQSVEDRGPNKQTTSYSAAAWEAQLNNLDIARGPVNGTNLSDWVQTMAFAPAANLPWLPAWHAPAPRAQYGAVAADGDPVTFSDAFGKWTTDVGLYVQTRRDGTNILLTNEYRWATALNRMEYQMPLTRSAAISPATWDQPAEAMPRTHAVRWSTSTGVNEAKFGEDANNPNIPVVHHDMTHVRWGTNPTQPVSTGQAHRYRDTGSSFDIPSVTIDLLYLLTSDLPAHRRQAAQLLSIEAGDPVFLSGDWYNNLQGVHFAVGIDESITPDGWDITLNLAPSHDVVGEESPPVPARLWDQATYPWNDETRRWDEA